MIRGQINFALIGCGRISKKYIEIFKSQRLTRAKLIAVCDIDLNKAKAAAKSFGISYYTDMNLMMKKEENIDVVVILTPSGLHARHTIKLAKFRKHIIVEKPMALRISDAKKMISSARKNKIKLFIVKQNRFNKPIQKLRQAFEKNDLGKIFFGSVRIRWSRDQKYYDQDGWRGTFAFDGGVFANQAAHYIDLLQWFLGRPKSVFAKGQRSFANIEAEDTGVAIIKFEKGIMATIEATVATRPNNLEGSFSLLGDEGSVEIGGFALNEIKKWELNNSTPFNIKEQFENPKNVYGFGHEKYLKHVVSAILDNKKNLVDGEEGIKSVEILAAIYESMALGKEVKISKNFISNKSKLGKLND